jgi:hypothetical protein
MQALGSRSALVKNTTTAKVIIDETITRPKVAKIDHRGLQALDQIYLNSDMA